MKCLDRFKLYKEWSLDQVLSAIRSGKIIAGRLAPKVKHSKHKSLKEIMEDGNRKLEQ